MDNNSIYYKVPDITSRHYWFVRTSSGIHYDDFVMHDYIAISWDTISVDYFRKHTEAEVKQQLLSTVYANNANRLNDDDEAIMADTSMKQQVSLAYNKLRRFINGFQVGDTVLIPDRNSDNVSIGIVSSDVYEDESYEERYYNENPGTEITPCPFHKRRNVQWLKHIPKASLDIFLTRALSAQHSVSCMDDYANVIDRCIYNFYTSQDNLHTVIHAGHPNGLSFAELKELINALDEAIRVTSKALNEEYNPYALDAKIAFHSPGLLEIAALIGTCGLSISVVMLALSHYRHGGKFNIHLTMKSENKDVNLEIGSDSTGTLEYENQRHQLDLSAFMKLKELEEPLEITYPTIESDIPVENKVQNSVDTQD